MDGRGRNCRQGLWLRLQCYDRAGFSMLTYPSFYGEENHDLYIVELNLVLLLRNCSARSCLGRASCSTIFFTMYSASSWFISNFTRLFSVFLFVKSVCPFLLSSLLGPLPPSPNGGIKGPLVEQALCLGSLSSTWDEGCCTGFSRGRISSTFLWSSHKMGFLTVLIDLAWYVYCFSFISPCELWFLDWVMPKYVT